MSPKSKPLKWASEDYHIHRFPLTLPTFVEAICSLSVNLHENKTINPDNVLFCVCPALHLLAATERRLWRMSAVFGDPQDHSHFHKLWNLFSSSNCFLAKPQSSRASPELSVKFHLRHTGWPQPSRLKPGSSGFGFSTMWRRELQKWTTLMILSLTLMSKLSTSMKA